MRLRHALSALLLCLVSGLTFAADATLSWVNPTQYTDGSPIPAGVLASTGIEYGLCDATGAAIAGTPSTASAAAPATTTVVSGLGNGSWCFHAKAVTVSGSYSTWSAMATKTIVLTPAAPTGLTVAVRTAFMAVRENDSYAMIPVGTVSGGTSCDSNNGVISSGIAYFAVPSASVTWYGATKPTVVLAQCS